MDAKKKFIPNTSYGEFGMKKGNTGSLEGKLPPKKKGKKMEVDKQRKAKLKKMVREKEKSLARAPEGALRMCLGREKPQYYLVRHRGEQPGTYLGKQQYKLVRRLAQKSYDEAVLEAARRELAAIHAYEKKMPVRCVEEVYGALSPARQELVEPIEPTDEEFVRAWTSVEWDHNWYKGEKPSYPTTNGEMTRSRIEALIADMLHSHGWYYRYEYPLRIVDRGRERVWHPDFTILDLKHRKEYILEYFGMLHDPVYQARMIEKMETYRENGYLEGFNIIYAFESETKPLDLKRLERYLERLLG